MKLVTDTSSPRRVGIVKDFWCRNVFLRCLLAIVGGRLWVWLIRFGLYPRIGGVVAEVGEITAAFSSLLLLLLTIMAINKSRPFNERGFFIGVIVAVLLGIAAVMTGLRLTVPLLLLSGAFLISAGIIWVSSILSLTLIRLDMTKVLGCLIAAALSCLINPVWVLQIPLLPLAILAAILPIGSIMLVRREIRELLAGDIHDLSLANPQSFLPLSHRLFTTFFVFSTFSCYALTFRSLEGVLPYTALAALPLIAIAVYVLVKRKRPRADTFFLVSFFLVIAGYLFMPSFPRAGIIQVSETLFFSGAECFAVVMWSVLAAIGKRNPAGAFSVIVYGCLANSLGALLGSVLGHITNGLALSSGLEFVFPALIVLGLLAYLLIGMRGFSFEQTICGIEQTVVPQPSIDVPALERQCVAVVQAFDLTPRESDILLYLARGYSGSAIQERLYLSRNTTKTHVRNIYGKLGVHAQQELIDLVEGFPLDGNPGRL